LITYLIALSYGIYGNCLRKYNDTLGSGSAGAEHPTLSLALSHAAITKWQWW